MGKNDQMGGFEGVSLVALDGRHRFVLPTGVEKSLPWLELPVDCLMLPGADGGVVVYGPEVLAALRSDRDALATEEPLGPEDRRLQHHRLARRLALSWTVRITRDRRVTLPDHVMGLLIPAGIERVALAAFRGILEIWPPEQLAIEAKRLAGSETPSL